MNSLGEDRTGSTAGLPSGSPGERVFYAYEVQDPAGMALQTAPVARDWMEQTRQRFAYRCLPLAIANQSGWLIPSPVTFSACWDGGPERQNVTITFAGPEDGRVVSHFGHGVVTLTLPYLFRTPAGINLWVKGATNWIKDGAQALEGVVETDWLPSTFTMNWKLTRPNYTVRFDRGEQVCMLVPVPRGLAEALEPQLDRLEHHPELAKLYATWTKERDAFIQALRQREPEAVARGWQRDYLKGLLPDGTRATEHQTRINLKEFARVERQPVAPAMGPPIANPALWDRLWSEMIVGPGS
jgi:hypothetical protein